MKPIQRIIISVVLAFFILSGLPLPIVFQGADDEMDLSLVITKLQKLSAQAGSESTDFTDSFRSTLSALQVAAGLKIIISADTRDEENSQALTVVVVRLPYLQPDTAELPDNIKENPLEIRTSVFRDTSIILSLDTPPPMV